MSILDRIITGSSDKVANCAIGLGNSEYHNNKILYATIKFLNQFKKNEFLKIYLFGEKEYTNLISENSSYSKHREKIELVDSENPTKTVFDYLSDFKVNCIIRGSLSSSRFLEQVKETFEIQKVHRLALLETHSGSQFFYGPVGIDECKDLSSKLDFVNLALDQIKSFGLTPNVSILSGGREGDLGRNARVDQTIKEAKEVVKHFQEMYPEILISHDEILIENAIDNNVNLIIAPDGISGNLIYRTLVHLGAGKAYGAIYMGLNKILVDTSRVGNLNEIYGALLLAYSLIE
ncbi:MAG: methanogenesis marker protein Mmp4/MtxX [Candidatus Lokiarchaeota archaeon]|nr:methanogenesis marker protein Mmp4/MtxX [Candidatus Lokiarchaeota archaeon]